MFVFKFEMKGNMVILLGIKVVSFFLLNLICFFYLKLQRWGWTAKPLCYRWPAFCLFFLLVEIFWFEFCPWWPWKLLWNATEVELIFYPSWNFLIFFLSRNFLFFLLNSRIFFWLHQKRKKGFSFDYPPY